MSSSVLTAQINKIKVNWRENYFKNFYIIHIHAVITSKKNVVTYQGLTT
jgi:hypothetical protein